MAALAAERDLLFGLLALQNGLIDQGQLVAAFQAWTLDKARALADHLVGRGVLDGEQRGLLEALVIQHLKKHGGDAQRSLAAIPAGRSTRERLARIGDAEISNTLAHVPSASAEHDDADRTTSYSVGTATGDGRRFRVLRPHARGGLGAVFIALDAELHREVALKQILDQHADDPTSRQRFLLEAEITGGLEHPGIVPVYGLGSYADGRPYYAMRFIKGDSLKEAIGRFHGDGALKTDPGRRSLGLRKLLHRFTDVCNAIEYAHSRGVRHRDIKPGNIIVGKHGETLVVDWGLAKATGRAEPGAEERTLVPSSASGSAETLPGSALGTPAYMSPEQARGEIENLGPRSDVYSLGATLYCLLTGRAPAEGDDVGAVLRAVQRAEFRPPRQLDPAIDRALEAVSLKAMALRPQERYATPRALAEDLERWMADEPVSAWREPRWKRWARWGRRHQPAVAGAAALLVAAVVGLSVGTLLVNRERAKAEESFRQARAAVDEYFTAVSESKLLDQPRLEPLRKELLDSARRYYRRFLQQRGGDRSVRAEAAATYYRVAMVTLLIGSPAEALADAQEASALYRGLMRDHPGEDRYRSDLAICYNDLGNMLRQLGRSEEALRAYRDALALREVVARAHPDGARQQNELAKGHWTIAEALYDIGRPAEALPALEEARAINEKLVAGPPRAIDFPSDLGVHLNSAATFRIELAALDSRIGQLQLELGRIDEAVREGRKACELIEGLARDHPEDLRAQVQLADIYDT
jgi:serine/threonine-protein kinase